MRTGFLVSATGHGALIVLAALGLPWLGPRERPPIRVTEVSFVSEAEFAAAQSAAEGPRAPDAPARPPAPRLEPEVLEAPDEPVVQAPEPPPPAPAPEQKT